LNYACEIIQASKDIQSDAVVTSPDLGGQNVFKTFKMAIRQNRRTTSTELNKIFCRWIYFHLLFKKYFFTLLGRGGAIPHIAPPMDQPLVSSLKATCKVALQLETGTRRTTISRQRLMH